MTVLSLNKNSSGFSVTMNFLSLFICCVLNTMVWAEYGFVPAINRPLLRRSIKARDMLTKPDESAMIQSFYDVTSLHSCLAKCPKRDDCYAIVYASTSAACSLYSTSDGAVAVQDEEKAVSVISSIIQHRDVRYLNPTDVALSSAGASCSAIGTTADGPCSGAIDGITQEVTQTQWASSQSGVGIWYKVDFPGDRNVVAVGLFNKCKMTAQCDRWTVGFSDGTALQIHRDCNGHPTAQDCTGQKEEQYLINPTMTSHILFTCARRCDPVEYVGLIEVYVWAI